MIIRGMAVGEVEPADILKVMWKEIRVGMLCGLSLALVNFVRLMIQYPGQYLFLCLSMCIPISIQILTVSAPPLNQSRHQWYYHYGQKTGDRN